MFLVKLIISESITLFATFECLCFDLLRATSNHAALHWIEFNVQKVSVRNICDSIIIFSCQKEVSRGEQVREVRRKVGQQGSPQERGYA